MKLIFAIVNNDDSTLASSALTEAGFSVTKLSTTGGFLMVGNSTLLVGTDEKGAQKVIDILKKYCTTRKHVPALTASYGVGMSHMSVPNEVTVGGATIFVLDVDHMEKI